MSSHSNIYDVDLGNPVAVANAGDLCQALDYSAQASQANREGRTEEAIRLQKSAIAIKIRVCGETSVQAALSYNELGDFYLQTHNLDAAEQALNKALRVRDNAEFGGMGQGPQFDAAVSREYFAQLKEAQGHFAEAKKVRKRGASNMKEEMACGNNKCPGQMFAMDQMKHCAACTCAYYCSRACQKADWKQRHKSLCLEYGAAAKAELQGELITACRPIVIPYS